ncbi:MAG: hypothetical protein J7599_23495 [Niabella sp.]|nr:hypothetical protein [Niabella sp.]
MNLYLTPNPYIIDTARIKKINDKFYAGVARQDRMPVLLPYGTGKPMPNTGKGMNQADRMPNLWNKPQKDSSIRDQGFYKRPLHYDTIPSLTAR